MASGFSEFPNSDIVDAKIREALTSKADKATTYTKTEVDTKIGGFVDGAEYDSYQKKIFLKHGTTTVAEVDATSFIKDGMVSSVEVVSGNLVITFNTDAGQEPIEVPLTDIFDPSNYYDKDAVDNLLDGKQDALTFDNAPTSGSANPVKSGGIWSAIWGALSALPAGFASLYDWCVSQLAGKLDKSGGTMTGPLEMGEQQLLFGNGRYCIVQFENSLAILDMYNAINTKVPFSPTGEGVLALLQNLAPNYSQQTTYAVNQLCVSNNVLKRCTTAGTGNAAVFTNATVEDVLAALRTGKANRAANPTAGNLAALDANGNPTDSLIPAANVATKGAIPYSLGTPTVISTASSEVVEGETVTYGAALLTNRTANIVQVTAATALDELRITFPAATSGKVRDFGLRVEIGTGSAALAAPALVPIAPTGETIKIENADGTIPELADGTATAKGVTLLYFSETAPGVFVVKGEQVEEVA